MAHNRVDFAGRTLIDLTGDTVTPDTLAEGATAHDKSGARITGSAKMGGGGLPSNLVPGNTPVQSVWAFAQVNSTGMQEVNPITVKRSGGYRVRYTAMPNGTSYGVQATGSHKIYVNHSPVKAQALSVDQNDMYSQDLQLQQGDVVALAMAAGQSSGIGIGGRTTPMATFGMELCIDWDI